MGRASPGGNLSLTRLLDVPNDFAAIARDHAGIHTDIDIGAKIPCTPVDERGCDPTRMEGICLTGTIDSKVRIGISRSQWDTVGKEYA